MLMILASARAFLARLPWQIWAALAVVAFLVIIWNVAGNAGEARVEADVANADRKAVETARGADEAAQGKIEATRTEVEETNDEAREAATGSSDPLGDALRSLRGN